MSDRLRIALVAEGSTDRVVIEAALRFILGSRPFVLNQLQPVGSVAFGPMGAGWSGVYRWCQQAVSPWRCGAVPPRGLCKDPTAGKLHWEHVVSTGSPPGSTSSLVSTRTPLK